MSEVREGYIPFKGYKTYYRIVGHNEKGHLPLLVLNGGPGMSHDYMTTLDALADCGREVIYYDQIGCGRSAVPEGTFHYNAQLFVDELVVVRKALGLEHFHLLGQSWGTILMLLYLLQEKPEGIASIVVSSGLPSTKLWVKEVGKLKSFMPKEMQEALDEADRTGNYDTPEAKAAADEFYRRHVCSLPEYPDFVMKSFAEPGPAYVEMQGVSEFVFTGNLLSYDVEDQLKDVKQPALVISGEFDECMWQRPSTTSWQTRRAGCSSRTARTSATSSSRRFTTRRSRSSSSATSRTFQNHWAAALRLKLGPPSFFWGRDLHPPVD
ncbi:MULTISPECIES: proline iminopeptidase-family hydrolase [unclassified Olsenella]|uniref:proline iminopeptidase-family hydrolase n=1 Tax=unclassified Olsenella TaxID=2638792 RepID=UPI001314AD46|nr:MULTISPECIES: proline iminopeptidase-family hydrolase [unclassified Olsenella]